MRLYPFHPHSPIVRLRVRPDHDDPAAIVGRHGPRQPHTDAAVAAVRRLIEQSTLNYRQIAARTGVSTGSISNWTRDGGWKRPPFAPRACDTIPTPRATREAQAPHARGAPRRARRAPYPRAGGERVRRPRQARRGAGAPQHGAARRQSRRRPRRRPGEIAPEEASRPITQLCVGGVDLSRAPRAAVEDFLANRERPREEDLPPRGSRGSRRAREHAWMREKERP